jgi:hypothetical protein
MAAGWHIPVPKRGTQGLLSKDKSWTLEPGANKASLPYLAKLNLGSATNNLFSTYFPANYFPPKSLPILLIG